MILCWNQYLVFCLLSPLGFPLSLLSSELLSHEIATFCILFFWIKPRFLFSQASVYSVGSWSSKSLISPSPCDVSPSTADNNAPPCLPSSALHLTVFLSCTKKISEREVEEEDSDFTVVYYIERHSEKHITPNEAQVCQGLQARMQGFRGSSLTGQECLQSF